MTLIFSPLDLEQQGGEHRKFKTPLDSIHREDGSQGNCWLTANANYGPSAQILCVMLSIFHYTKGFVGCV
jgi:hypothetical protein